MKKLHISIITLIAFLIGGFGGFGLEHYRAVDGYKKLEYKYSQRNLSLQLDKVSSDFNYLLNFHKGDTNAVIYDLERQLDTGVVYLSQLKKPQTDDDPSMYDDLFPAIKAYRIKYPSHSNSTNWDNKVAAAMEKIP